jgi:uncharacterized LabA/DUF88 family protein
VSGGSHTWGFLFSEDILVVGGKRAILFIDGNNWYHGMKSVGVEQPAQLSYCKIAAKLVGAARSWVASRYYIGRVTQEWSRQLVADQRRFLSQYEAEDSRNTVHYGRLERREVRSEAAHELLAYLGALKTKIDQSVYQHLIDIGNRHKNAYTQVEKAVDVMLAVDLVIKAQRDEFDVAYILSADGDYTPAVSFVRESGKAVFAVSATSGAELAKTVNSFIRIRKEWFADCYK